MKKAIVIGAGPAGLTAAYELVTRTGYIPVIYERTSDVGGISKTVVYKGNRMDIGGHRFFSKSERVMEWWQSLMPNQDASNDPSVKDEVMLVRNRLSRIFYLRRFFDYPISLSFTTIRNLGLVRTVRIGLSYLWIRLFPIRKEKSLEDFFINRFGRVLYKTFFRDYTEKIWGIPCRLISAEWGAQRIKGLSISRALIHALKKLIEKKSDIEQRQTETSLIERFLYPKYGPGQMWEEVARAIKAKGGELHLNQEVVGLTVQDEKVRKVEVRDIRTGKRKTVTADLVFSTMAVKDLIEAMGDHPPLNVRKTASGLVYRDFITVGLLLKKLKHGRQAGKENDGLLRDNWIYIQEKYVKVGRIQIFNNWSPYLVRDKDLVWVGMEYFCQEGDDLWEKQDSEMIEMAVREMSELGFIERSDFLDGTVVRMVKTYPAYFGTYPKFHIIRQYTDSIQNLYLIGRNGMHRYNNQDHSMLTAMVAVDNIAKNSQQKENIWTVNTEQEYHESK